MANNKNRRSWSASARCRVVALYDGACFYCGMGLARAGAYLDHVVPLALGGEDAEHNLVPACVFCNGLKSAEHPEAFTGQRIEFADRRWRLGEPFDLLTYAEETSIKFAAQVLDFAWSRGVTLAELPRAVEASP